MELKINDKLHGFTVTNVREFDGFDGQLVEMVHDRTGAGLVWADNGDENKLFSVGFRTLPEDSTGVFHILEHSVLCGSEKFPVKEPFVELIKTSMNTFLNAMTYSDKTLYPVSSRMEQDYMNLMEVYLDAVFRPAILTNPNIFYQEGWHIDTEGGVPHFRGVVFNEMKGAMSDVDQVAERTMGKLLFPDTCYGYNSGGDPDAIPDLTYEDFIARYKRFYHPTNAYFYLDGDITIENTLAMIETYLEGYDRLTDLPQIEMQQPAPASDVCKFAAGGEDDKAVVCFGRIAGTWEDRDKLLALSVLTEQLADSNESPLKRAVLSSGLAEDMEVYISDGIAQPYLVLLFRGVDPAALGGGAADAGEQLLGIVRDTVRKVIEEGIPEKDLHASVNQLDFRLRQYPEPQALYRANAVFNSWLYGGDPALYLKNKEAIDNLRAAIGSGEISRLAEEYLIDTDGFSRLDLMPSMTLTEEQADEEAEQTRQKLLELYGITEYTNEKEESASADTGSAGSVDASVNAADAEAAENGAAGSADNSASAAAGGCGGAAVLEALNEELHRWQAEPDSEEALATIPKLDLSDIRREPMLIGTEVSESNGVTVLYHPVASNGIVYLNAYFPITDLALEELPAAALITELYKDLPTENYSVLELQNEIKTYVGSISFGIDINAKDLDNKSCTPCLRARAAVLRENLSHAEELLIEILTRTKFDDKALIREVLTQIDEEDKRLAVSTGHKLAIYAARSHYSSRDAAAEAVNGITFMNYIRDFCADFDGKIDGFTGFARDLIGRTVVRQGAIVSVTATEPADVCGFTGMLGDGTARPASAVYASSMPRRLGIQVPASVSHSVQAYDLSEAGVRAGGSLSVAANILTFAYLWNEVRVKGGAYGTSASVNRTGSMFCYSFRDPSPAASLEVYKNAAAFLDAFSSAEGMDLSGFIISTIASTEPLLSPAAKGRAADDFWISGFTNEDRVRLRGEILGTTPEQLKSWCDAYKRLAADGCVCVIGPRAALDTCPDLEIVSI